jgi:adenylate kinase
MILVLTGAPGAGKGTQADLIAERMGFRKISTGDALRNQIKLGTPIGKQAAEFMNHGRLVPDDTLFGVLKQELGQNTKEKILLDGYPRNVEQAKALDTLAEVHPVKGAVQLDVPKEDIVGRISGRRVCGTCGATFHIHASPPKKEDVCDKCQAALICRPDDQPDKVLVRLQVYDQSTRPVLDYYKAKGLCWAVNGVGETEAIYRELKKVIDRIV